VAQSCCANDTRNFANYWVHNGFITMSDQKMSKSLGNIQLIREVLAETKGEVARWVLLSAHYRQSVDWTDETVAQAEKTIDRIYSTLRDVKDLAIDDDIAIDDEFLAALDDDLNTPKAFARINQLAKLLANAKTTTEQSKLKSTLLKSSALLGVLQTEPEAWFAQKQVGGEAIKTQVEQLIVERNQARTDKNWGRSDEIRDELDALGVILEDSPEGTRWSMK
jgi:cysteinyl-tRNA synthetase